MSSKLLIKRAKNQSVINIFVTFDGIKGA